MAYLFITRMFSGLQETIRTGVWQPTGIPAFVQLAERLVRVAPITWCIVAQTAAESAVVGHRRRSLQFPNGVRMVVLPRRPITGVHRIDTVLSAVPLLIRTIARVIATPHAVCYCDRSNIIAAALVKMILRRPVVIRVLGIYPGQRALVESLRARLRAPMTTLAYRVRYDLAMCTQDGTGSEYYFPRLLPRATNRVLLCNGAPVPVRDAQIDRTPGPFRLLFVGTLQPSKGIDDFVTALAMLKARGHTFIAEIVGKGPSEDDVRARVHATGLGDMVQMIGTMPLAAMHAVYARADVYVSLNALGNLSNTVLEAMAAGKCIIMLGPDPVTHADEETIRVVPRDAVIRVDRSRIVTELTERLADLIEHPEYVAVYASRMRAFAPQFLMSWDERIAREHALLDALLAQDSRTRGAAACSRASGISTTVHHL